MLEENGLGMNVGATQPLNVTVDSESTEKDSTVCSWCGSSEACISFIDEAGALQVRCLYCAPEEKIDEFLSKWEAYMLSGSNIHAMEVSVGFITDENVYTTHKPVPTGMFNGDDDPVEIWNAISSQMPT